MTMEQKEFSYGKMIWKQFLNHKLGPAALFVVGIFCLVGIYAPFLASSKPIAIVFDGEWYFPLFRYLFYPGFYTKKIDIFFNIMMLTLPLLLLGMLFLYKRQRFLKRYIGPVCFLQISVFVLLLYLPQKDPASDPVLTQEKQEAVRELKEKGQPRTWKFDLQFMTPYGKLNQVLRYRQREQQHERIHSLGKQYVKDQLKSWLQGKEQKIRAEMIQKGVSLDELPGSSELKKQILQNTDPSVIEEVTSIPTLWQVEQEHEQKRFERYRQQIAKYESGASSDENAYRKALAAVEYTLQKRLWIKKQNETITFELMPFFRPFHWEDDVGGEQSMNQFLPWYELSRINRKDLVSALIFGVRISLVVGILAVSLAMSIGIPIGSLAGYYGGKFDILVSRLLEIWESMPTFFMLLLVVAITQSKSIFLVIAVVGIFGWTGFSRYIRGEFFKQRNLPYVEACHAQGFNDSYIMFTHILPNAIPPVLTLLPFAIMGAITSEAALSFLGLGEEGSCSWGVLMDEGRSAFPGESYLLWPPAILLTLLLVSIALVGDALRDAIDPKMHR